MLDLAKEDPSGIGVIVNNYIHILENDFRGIDNIESITGETNGEITNGIRSIQLINKVTKGSSSTQFTAGIMKDLVLLSLKLMNYILQVLKILILRLNIIMDL